MTVCGTCGEAEKNESRCPLPLSWMHKVLAVHRRAGRAVTMQAKKSKAASALVVDTLGLLLAVSVCAANWQDRDAGTEAVARAAEKYPTVQRLFVDTAYAGTWGTTVEDKHGWTVEVIRHPANRNVGRWVDSGQQDLFA